MNRHDYPAPPLDTFRAINDLRVAGIEIRAIDERVFTVSRPSLDRGKWAADFLFDGSWHHSGLRKKGTDPIKDMGLDFSDPEQLACNVRRDHDYPDPDMMGHILD